MIYAKPDRFLSVKDLAEEAKLPKELARKRLANFSLNGVIRSYFTTMGSSTYTLRPGDTYLDFSDDPVDELTFEKLMELFSHYHFQLTIAKIIAGTGLNLKQIKKALREFARDKVIYTVQDFQHNKVILLREPYRSNLATLSLPPVKSETLDLEKLRDKIEERKEISSRDLAREHHMPEERAQALLEQLAEKMNLLKEVKANGETIYRV